MKYIIAQYVTGKGNKNNTFYAIMTIHVPTNLAGTNNKAHTGTDK